MRKEEACNRNQSPLLQKKKSEEAGEIMVLDPTLIMERLLNSHPQELLPKKLPQQALVITKAYQRALDLPTIKKRNKTIGTI